MASWIIWSVSALLALLVVVGISMMSKPQTAKAGNQLSALAMLMGILFTLIQTKAEVATPLALAWIIYPSLILGAVIGGLIAVRVKMIQMPQMVALLNGLGGGASALVGILSVAGIGVEESASYAQFQTFFSVTGYLAIAVGVITLVGSLVAAGKLHRVISQRPQVWPFHSWVTVLSLLLVIAFIALGSLPFTNDLMTYSTVSGVVVFSALFGLYFSIRVGGADMPITISLLNSLSGVAGAIAGMAIGDVLLVAVGGIVGASGLLLTQIMCKAMNRRLSSILFARSPKVYKQHVAERSPEMDTPQKRKEKKEEDPVEKLATAKRVIIVPGYGMALAQAQHQVKQLADALAARGAEVRYAIHPVAGRMPGHMNVLLAEANVSYDELYQMENINEDFSKVDAVVVIGANDVLNPSARDAEGTPIYGMPVLNVDQAPYVVICNYDLKPGYAGVENPLYHKEKGVSLLLGDAKESLKKLIEGLARVGVASSTSNPSVEGKEKKEDDPVAKLATAKRVIIVPGYGMALAQAQHQVKQLADALAARGAEVRYAIHPVAGRMPGHMNVLLAEANVSYDELYQMENINEDFSKVDAVVVIGANDVLNPSARDAEGTPIYGMPVLNVDQAPYVVICNYDLKPGYAGVENPLYHKEEGVSLLLGDAKESLNKLIEGLAKH